MQHFRPAFEDARPLTNDEAAVLRLPGAPPALADWQRTLHRAADIIENVGWCRGTLRRGAGYCAAGAIIAAFNKGEIPRDECLDSFLLAKPAVQWIIVKVESYLRQPDLMSWNDRQARSGEEVASALRAVAGQRSYLKLSPPFAIG